MILHEKGVHMSENTVPKIENNIEELFDSQFSVSKLAEAVNCSDNKSKETIGAARDAVRKTINSDDGKKKFYVDIPEDVEEALESGEVKFIEGKNGKHYAQLRKKDGKFGEKLSINEELEEHDVSFDELKLAIQMEAIAEQLKSVIKTLEEIESQIADVRMDQRNDRVGLFYSGMSLYIEATQVNDEGLKKLLMAQALKSINDSNSQMIQNIRSSVDFLVNSKYKKRKDSIKLIDDNLLDIKQCYEIVYRSAIMKALIYQNCGEIKAMALSLDEYSRFISSLILPYTGVLSELDKDSKFIAKGPWGKIGNTMISCSLMKNILASNDELIIEMRDNNG